MTVKPPVRETELPSGLLTVTVRAPRVAFAAMLTVATSSASDTNVTVATLTSAPKLTVAPLWKFAPSMVTSRVSVWPPLDGVIVPINGFVVRAASASNTRILGLVTPLMDSVTGSPVETRASRIWSTVAVGAACFRTAHAPAT